MKRLRDQFSYSSKIRYLLWRALSAHQPLIVALNNGTRIAVRQPPADDLGIAYEVFVGNAYKSPRRLDPDSVERIVDLGANVGYTCVYWLANFPNAEVIAFEPHPIHVNFIQTHLAINRSGGRVQLYQAAASTQAGDTFLTDDGCRSTTVSGGASSIRVPQVDFFACIGAQPIDVLKIDIEGGEYEILRDLRFDRLNVKTLALEWHQHPAYPRGGEWCASRLRQLGYEVSPSSDIKAEQGTLWAFRS